MTTTIYPTIIMGNRTLDETICNGKYTKIFREYYANKQLHQEITYTGKKIDGHIKKWFTTGVLAKHLEYTDGKRNGVFQRWHHNGQCSVLGEYSQGKRAGTWKYWKNDGSSLREDRTYPV